MMLFYSERSQIRKQYMEDKGGSKTFMDKNNRCYFDSFNYLFEMEFMKRILPSLSAETECSSDYLNVLEDSRYNNNNNNNKKKQKDNKYNNHKGSLGQKNNPEPPKNTDDANNVLFEDGLCEITPATKELETFDPIIAGFNDEERAALESFIRDLKSSDLKYELYPIDEDKYLAEDIYDKTRKIMVISRYRSL